MFIKASTEVVGNGSALVYAVPVGRTFFAKRIILTFHPAGAVVPGPIAFLSVNGFGLGGDTFLLTPAPGQYIAELDLANAPFVFSASFILTVGNVNAADLSDAVVLGVEV